MTRRARASLADRDAAAMTTEVSKDFAAPQLPATPASAVEAASSDLKAASPEAPKEAAASAKKAPAKKAPPTAKAPAPKTTGKAPEVGDDGWIRVGMRVSPELAQQVAEYKRHLAEEATYGQLATWACEDHPQEVVAMVGQIITERSSAVASPSAGERVSRVPRGRRGPSTSSAQLNPTFLPEEFQVVEGVQRQVRHPEGKDVPRTWVITAALRVAIRH